MRVGLSDEERESVSYIAAQLLQDDDTVAR